MSDKSQSEFSDTQGLKLALSYLVNPADVPCPVCGPGTMEVVAYLDSEAMENSEVITCFPYSDKQYTVVLICNQCRRSAAIDLFAEGNKEIPPS